MKRIGFPLAGRAGSNENSADARPGGADVSTLALAKSLVGAGYEPVILLHIDGPMAAYVREMGLKCVVVGIPVFDKRKPIADENVQYLRDEATRIGELLTENGIAIVHTNDASMHRAWGHLAQFITFKHFWHERGLFQHPAASVEHLKKATEVLTISSYVAGRAPEDIAERVRVIDNPIAVTIPVDKQNDRVWLRKLLNVPAESLVFVMVANENLRKRWEIFMEAGAKAAVQRSDMHFCTIGLTKKDYLRDLMKLWPEECLKQMHHLGYRYDAPRIISGADVLVATAKQEPLGRTVVEAALVETPVMAAKSGGFIEMFDSIAPDYLVSPDNVNTFAKRFINVEEFIGESQDSLNSIKISFSEKFDLDRHLAEMVGIYRKYIDF